jgi:hypothetical protein
VRGAVDGHPRHRRTHLSLKKTRVTRTARVCVCVYEALECASVDRNREVAL